MSIAERKLAKQKMNETISKNEHVPLMNNACRLFLNSTDSRCYNVITNITPVRYNPTKITTASPPSVPGMMVRKGHNKNLHAACPESIDGGDLTPGHGMSCDIEPFRKGNKKIQSNFMMLHRSSARTPTLCIRYQSHSYDGLQHDGDHVYRNTFNLLGVHFWKRRMIFTFKINLFKEKKIKLMIPNV